MVSSRASHASIQCARAICWCTALVLAPCAFADICKYVDADGNMHYTNVAPEKGWKKLSCGVGDEVRGEQKDAQKYANRLSKLRQAVSLHEKNIEALRKELAALK